MSDIRHPSAGLRAAYATGALPAGPAVTVGVHVQACASCRAAVAILEEAEGQLLEAQAPVDLPIDALDQVMARLGGRAPATSKPPRTVGDVALPDLVAEMGVLPRRWLTPGLWVAHLTTSDPDDWRTFILRAPAGTTIPAHGHRVRSTSASCAAPSGTARCFRRATSWSTGPAPTTAWRWRRWSPASA